LLEIKITLLRLISFAWPTKTEAEIGAELGVSPTTINGWRHGNRPDWLKRHESLQTYHYDLIQNLMGKSKLSDSDRQFLLDSLSDLQSKAARATQLADAIVLRVLSETRSVGGS
jgi:hypothetical protein